MGGGPSKPNNATSINDTSVAGSIVAQVRSSAVDSASQNSMTNMLMVDEGLHSNLSMCLEQSNVDVSVQRLKQSAKIDLSQAQTQCMTTIITQIAHSLAKNLGSNDKASSKNYVKLSTDLFASAVASENISCSQSSDTSFVMRNTGDSAGLSLTAKQNNVVVSTLIASCMQKAIANQTQTQTDDMTVKQTATSKAIGVKSLGLLGELESVVISVAAIVITVALTCAVLVSVRKFDKLAQGALIIAFVTGYGIVGGMAVLKKTSAFFLQQDKAQTLSDCDANIDEYDAAGKNLRATRPYCFCVPHQLPDGQSHPDLTGFAFKTAVKDVHYTDIQKTLEARYEASRGDAAPIQAAVFVRDQTYESAVRGAYDDTDDLTTPNLANFIKLQKANPTFVNQHQGGTGMLYLYTLPGGKVGPNENYASCTAGSVGGIEVVPADAGMQTGSGTGVRVLDDGSGGVNNQFTAMPYPVSKDVEISEGKPTVSEQSWVVVSKDGGQLPNIKQPATFASDGTPSNLEGAVDVLTLPWMVSEASDHPLSHNDAALGTYRTNLSALTDLDQPVYPSSDKGIQKVVDYPRSDDTTTVKVQRVDSAAFPPVYNPDISPQENFENQTTNASNTPQWIYGSAVAIDDNVPITAVANTVVQFMVADRRTMLPYGASADTAITYREAVERKREACQQQMLVYLVAYVALFCANGGVAIAGALPKEKSAITLVVGIVGAVVVGIILWLKK